MARRLERRMMIFIKQVEEQLSRMSVAEKEEWILSQARLLSEREQQDFLMSLSGEKKIIYMPSQREIEEFCGKVECGENYLEYETHYYEFDDDGRYMDDWEVWHNDPSGAMPFLNRTFKGCHDLLILNEYTTAADILGRICALVRIFKHPVCRKINPSILIEEAIPEGLFSHMLNILNTEILGGEIMFNKMFSEIEYSHEKYLFEKELKGKQEIALDIRLKCLAPVQKKPQQKVSTLASFWEQIQELLEQLRFERYIDNQWEIGEVWKICEALIRNGKE